MRGKPTGFLKWAKRGLAVVMAFAFTLLCFLVLPLMQTIGAPPANDLLLHGADTATLEPPPPPPTEPEPEPEPEPEEPPPDLADEAPPLDLAQIELALNPGLGGGFGDIAASLPGQAVVQQSASDIDRVFQLADLDQKPRIVFQRPPRYPPDLRRRGRTGVVYVLFMVDTDGRVQNPKVEKSTDPAFERPALEAVRQWRFEPGKRGGEAVPFKMRIPIRFGEK